MPSLTPRPTLPLLGLALALGASAASAQTCTRHMDYAMTVDYDTPSSITATEADLATGHARFRAWRVVDDAMKADLDASVAAGCAQRVVGFEGLARLATAGYCNAEFSGGNSLDGYRPSTGHQWNIAYWSEYEALSKFGGELVRQYKHRTAAPARLAGRARVGDEVSVVSAINLSVFCFGDPDSIADQGDAHYGWGGAPSPVVRIWLP